MSINKAEVFPISEEEAQRLLALWRSIVHYHRDIWPDPELAFGMKAHRGDDCPLCALHYNRYAPKACYGCPVHRKTRRDNCRGTPWIEMNSLMARRYGDVWFVTEENRPSEEQVREAIIDEISFLVDLLP